jgi:hypothetical protein
MDFGYILAVHGDHEIDVAGHPGQAGGDHCETAHDNMPGAARVQFAPSIGSIHSSASSWVLNR